MSNNDWLDCWQHKIGIIEGCLRAYSAPQEVMSALQWMKQNIEPEDGLPAGEAAASFVDMMQSKAKLREEKPDREPIPLTPSTEEVAAKVRGFTADEELLILDLLRKGADTASIKDHFPKKTYQQVWYKANQLKSSGRV